MSKLSNLQVGDYVWSYLYGDGEVISLKDDDYSPIFVHFPGKAIYQGYNIDGCLDEESERPDLFVNRPNMIPIRDNMECPHMVESGDKIVAYLATKDLAKIIVYAFKANYNAIFSENESRVTEEEDIFKLNKLK